MKRQIECDPEILFIAINDGSNIFCRDVLIANGYLDEEVRFLEAVKQAQDKIARDVSERWKLSWHDDEA
jgi:hypothetical protein